MCVKFPNPELNCCFIAEIKVRYCMPIVLKSKKPFDGGLFVTFLHFMDKKRVLVREITIQYKQYFYN